MNDSNQTSAHLQGDKIIAELERLLSNGEDVKAELERLLSDGESVKAELEYLLADDNMTATDPNSY